MHLSSLPRDARRDAQHKPWIRREEDDPPGAEEVGMPTSASKAAQGFRNNYVH